MNEFLTSILRAINSVIQNHGLSIVVFTILIRLVLMPLDVKSRKGMRKMQKMQPQINELTKRYKNDQQKLQRKQQELFQKEHYNPLSGCLPMLIQMPILFAMFAAMRYVAGQEMVQEAFHFLSGSENLVLDNFLWIKSVWMPDTPFAPYVPDFNALSMIDFKIWQSAFDALTPEALGAITANIPNYTQGMLDFTNAATTRTTVDTLVNAMAKLPAYQAAIAPVSGWQNLNLLFFNVTVFQNFNGLMILPVLAFVSQMLMTKFMNTAQPAAANDNGQAASTAKMMQYMFPIMSVFFCLTSNAGFAIYWVTSNLIATGQTLFINRYLDYKELHPSPEKPKYTNIDKGDIK